VSNRSKKQEEQMEGFVTGVLAENKAGATYEGVIYDRFLRLHLMAGQVLEVFDPFEPISTDLPTGEIYKFILSSLAKSVRYFPREVLPPPLQTDLWQGTVIETNWRFRREEYSGIRSSAYEREWVVLSTAEGRLLMNPKEIGTQVYPGDIIQWQNLRFDLYAIQ
jgi:hypothetical protein